MMLDLKIQKIQNSEHTQNLYACANLTQHENISQCIQLSPWSEDFS